MAVQAQTTFSSFTLTEQEQLAGSCLTLEQKLFLQNALALAAEEKLSLVPDAASYSSFIQQEAHLAGQIAAYRYLLDCSTASEEALLELARAA